MTENSDGSNFLLERKRGTPPRKKIKSEIKVDRKQIRQKFKRFDIDSSTVQQQEGYTVIP